MIQNSERLQMIIEHILEKVVIIKNDLNTNGETHCDYILEKLNSAKWDLDLLVEMTKNFKNGNKEIYEEETL